MMNNFKIEMPCVVEMMKARKKVKKEVDKTTLQVAAKIIECRPMQKWCGPRK